MARRLKRNKYRFNARWREKLWWLEYWNTYAWEFRRIEAQERGGKRIRRLHGICLQKKSALIEKYIKRGIFHDETSIASIL